MEESRSASSSTELLEPGEDDIASLQDEGDAPSVNFAHFIRSLGERRRIVLSILAVGITLSLLDAILAPSIFTSTTKLMPPGNTSPFGSIMSMLSNNSAAGITDEMLGVGTPGELYVAILKSRNVQDALINRFDLLKYYDAHMMVDARKSLSSDTEVAQDDKSGIITVTVNAITPQMAARLAQGYVTELNRVVTEDSTSSARREREFLEGRVKDVKQDLDQSSKALSQFSTKSKAIDIGAQAKSMVDAGLRLQSELIEGRSELAGLLQTYSEDNARVKAVEARNAELQREIDAMGGVSRPGGNVGDVGSSLYPSVSELPALGLTYFDLERKVKVDEAVWETLTKEYEVAKVEEAKQIPTVRVLDVGDLPERKSGPSRRLIVLGGTALSFLLACLVVFALDFWERMDPASDIKKLIMDAAGPVLRLRRRRQTKVEAQ